MSNYRRALVPGGTYFFTVVTRNRKPVFANQLHVDALRHALRKVRSSRPFAMNAIVVLPDHLHCIWRLPEGDSDYSGRWREIKKLVSKVVAPIPDGNNERSVWQRRFWEHAIRSEDDWRRHMDYIHYNPVKHGLVHRPADWPWSSFSACVERGLYDKNWGACESDELAELDFE